MQASSALAIGPSTPPTRLAGCEAPHLAVGEAARERLAARRRCRERVTTTAAQPRNLSLRRAQFL